jgi:hypothetical protein
MFCKRKVMFCILLLHRSVLPYLRLADVLPPLVWSRVTYGQFKHARRQLAQTLMTIHATDWLRRNTTPNLSLTFSATWLQEQSPDCSACQEGAIAAISRVPTKIASYLNRTCVHMAVILCKTPHRLVHEQQHFGGSCWVLAEQKVTKTN